MKPNTILSGLLKLLFVIAGVSATSYSMLVFGSGFWSWLFLGISGVVFVSIFVERLDPIVSILGIGTALLSAISLAILLIAGTIGGSFHLSESNVIFALLLVFLSTTGFLSLCWGNRMIEPPEPDVGVPRIRYQNGHA